MVAPAPGGDLPEGDGLQPADRYGSPRRPWPMILEHWLADEPVSAWREPF